MKIFQTIKIPFLSLLLMFPTLAIAQLNNFSIADKQNQFSGNPVSNETQFNGYTNYWQDNFSTWHRYGNLFKIASPNVEKSIMQSKVDIGEDMGIPGLIMQECFVNNLLATSYTELHDPSMQQIESSIGKGNTLVYVDPESETGKSLIANFPFHNEWPEMLKSHKYG